MGNSGENWEKVAKVGKNGEKLEKVLKSVEKYVLSKDNT